MNKPNKILKPPFHSVSLAYLTTLAFLAQLFSKYVLLWDKIVTIYHVKKT